jgi:hypothetical protein
MSMRQSNFCSTLHSSSFFGRFWGVLVGGAAFAIFVVSE